MSTSLSALRERLDFIAPTALFERLEQLSPRERRIVIITASAVLFFILFTAFKTGMGRLEKLERQADATQKALVKIQGFSADAQAKNQAGQSLQTRIRPAPGFYLSSFLENQAARYRIALDNLGTASTQDLGDGVEEVALDVKVANVGFTKALNFLSELENNNQAYVRFSRVRMKTIPNDPANVELSFKVAAYIKKTS